MASSLSTGSGSGTQQGSTQNLQAPVGSTGGAPANATSVQPGTATALLNGTQGVALKGQSLSVVNLGGRQSQTSQFAEPTAKHTNPVLFGIAGLLFVFAVILFVMTFRSAKNTTEDN